MNRLVRYVSLTVTALCLGACAPKHADYSQFTALDHDAWPYDTPVSFTPAPDDSVTAGVITVAVRHNNTYPYRNLWLEVKHTDRLGNRGTDTVNIQLADVYGHWLGKGIGGIYQTDARLCSGFDFSDSAMVSVRHIMRTDTLRGVTDVGVTIRSAR